MKMGLVRTNIPTSLFKNHRLMLYEMNHKNKFRIDAFTGAISTKAGIVIKDEQNAVYDLSVVASDRGRPALRYFVVVKLFED